MRVNQSSSIDRRRKNRPLAALCLATTGLFILMGSAASGRDSQGAREMKLSVEDPRPVAQAILKLQEEYGGVITYEDPLYVHDGEIADVTLKSWRLLYDLGMKKYYLNIRFVLKRNG